MCPRTQTLVLQSNKIFLIYIFNINYIVHPLLRKQPSHSSWAPFPLMQHILTRCTSVCSIQDRPLTLTGFIPSSPLSPLFFLFLKKWARSGSFMEKPSTGWLHDDSNIINGDGVFYAVKYIGSIPMGMSMSQVSTNNG